ncbi:MAG: NACHT domain-containing protein [Caldilineaceae bacterium]|nr:NACHT domain-containing protein [Caldilineaceae bacterium]
MTNNFQPHPQKVNTGGGVHIEGNVTAGGDFIGRDQIIIQRLDPTDARNQRNHDILRQRVKSFWIEDVLNHSLYNEVLIGLHLQERFDAVENRLWNLSQRRSGQDDRLLPANTPIINVFDWMNQSLLILGEPGSGKTTSLLDLTRDLLTRAEADPTHPTPVVFNLSSWPQRRESLSKWLVDELQTKYMIAKKMAEAWVNGDELLLLLDGLDEVQQEYRDACVTAINQFCQEHLVALVICCRVAEYTDLSAPLTLWGAVLVQPLTVEQIDDYLTKVGSKLASVHTMIQQDKDFRELAASPLMLSIMSLAYQGLPITEVPYSTPSKTSRQHLFDTYIERMFGRREGNNRYTPRKTIRRLQWLASHLAQYGQSTFLIEQMQPTWGLSTMFGRLRVYTTMLVSGPLYGICVGLLFGLLFGIVHGILWVLAGGGELVFWLAIQAAVGMFWGFVIGSAIGLLTGIANGLTGGFRKIRVNESISTLWNDRKSTIYSAVFWGLSSSLFAGLWFWLSVGANIGLLATVRFGRPSLVSGAWVGSFRKIQPTDWSTWSWKKLKRNFGAGIVFGLCVAILNWLFLVSETVIVFFAAYLISTLHIVVDPKLDSMFGEDAKLGALFLEQLPHLLIFYQLQTGLLSGLLFGLLFGLFFEPDHRVEDLKALSTKTANQGIKLAAKNTIITGMVLGLIFGLIAGVLNGLVSALSIQVLGDKYFTYDRYGELPDQLVSNLEYMRMFGIIGGLFGGLLGGGDTVAKHYVLRFILWWQDHVPFNYARFLDYCVERIFLRRVGGGYIFIHRLLMEHFASLTDEDIERLASHVGK